MLDTSPLRGAIFENLAVFSVMKKRMNETNRPNMYFYRKNRGLEVDLLVAEGDGSIQIYEVKSSKTLQPDFADNMKKLSSSIGCKTKSTILYNGDSDPPLAINVRDI
ncbi:MAG: DUF4143 domain-containing protein [Clostridium sp.]|nr:DUF4143 domain-containing protein [Clostridium sp.]